MLVSYAIFGLFVLLHPALSFHDEYANPKPVDLSYSCMSVKSGDVHKNSAPILLLHGLGASKESWMGIYQILALKTGRRVCVADLRNHGESPWSNEADIEANAEDIFRLLETLKIPKVILLGHSLGGKIAVHCSLKYPEKVEKLIVEDMRPNGITTEAKSIISFFLGLLLDSVKAIPKGATENEAKEAIVDFINAALSKYKFPQIVDKKAAHFLPIKCSNGECSWKINTDLLGEVSKDMLKLLNQSSGIYNGPALFVYGTESPFKVKEDESSIQKLFPNAELVGVKGAGHVVHGRPEFLDAVIKFINAQE